MIQRFALLLRVGTCPCLYKTTATTNLTIPAQLVLYGAAAAAAGLAVTDRWCDGGRWFAEATRP